MLKIPQHTKICSDDTTIFFYSLKIQEPVTLFTDLLVTVLCLLFFLKLKKKKTLNKTVSNYNNFFLFMALATFFGGIFGHAFCYAFGIAFKLPGWILSMIAVMFSERASIYFASKSIRNFYSRFFLYANIVEFLTILSVTIITVNFFFVEFHAFYGLLIVSGMFQLFHFYKTKNNPSLIILASIAVAALAAFFQLSKISISIWFQYMDIAHCLMALSAYILFLAVSKINAESEAFQKEQYN